MALESGNPVIMIRSEYHNEILAELPGVVPDSLLIMTSFLKCHEFCRPLAGRTAIDEFLSRIDHDDLFINAREQLWVYSMGMANQSNANHQNNLAGVLLLFLIICSPSHSTSAPSTPLHPPPR